MLVHLWPSPVVARVTSGAPGVDPADVQRELSVARHAARAGAPVVPPSDLLPPGPHHRGGHTLVFWHYLVRVGELDAADAGRRLGVIHDALADYDGELPRAGRARRRCGRCSPPSRDRTTSSSSASWPRASFPTDKPCTATRTSSTASKPLPGRSATWNGVPRPAREYDLAALLGDPPGHPGQLLRCRPPAGRSRRGHARGGAPGVRRLDRRLVHGRGRPTPGRRAGPRAPAAVSPTLPPVAQPRLPAQSGYSSLRHERGSAGWACGVRSSRELKYGATNGSGAATV